MSEEPNSTDPQVGRTPAKQIVSETPRAARPSLSSTWGAMTGVLGDPGKRYGTLTASDRLSPSIKIKMLYDPVIGFSLAYIASKLVKAEYEVQCEDPQIRDFFAAMYGAFHTDFMLKAAMAIPIGSAGLIKRLEFKRPQPLEVGRPAVWKSGVTPYICTGFDQVSPVGAVPSFTKSGRFDGFTYAEGKVDRVFALWITIGKAKAFGKYKGTGRLESAYKMWWLGEFSYDQLAVHIQRFVDRALLIDFPPGKDDEGQEMSEIAISIGDSIRSGATAALPSSVYQVYDEAVGVDRLTAIRKWGARLLERAENVAAFISLADHIDARKAMGMLVPFQLYQGVKQSALGGPTTSDVLGKLATDLILQEASEIDWHVNTYLFPYLLRANFGASAPRVVKVTTGLNEYDRGEVFELLRILTRKDAGAASRIDQDLLAHRLGVPMVSAEEYAAAQPAQPPAQPAQPPAEDEPFGAALAARQPAPGHNAQRVLHRCPMCGGEEADRYDDHGGLHVCASCGATYAPEFYDV